MKYLKLFLVIILVIGCTACDNEDIPEATIDQDIILVYQYINYATTYTNKGYYIDKNGDKTEFDVSDEDKKYSDINELVSYLEQHKIDETENTFSDKDMQKIYYYLYKIDKDSEIKENSVGCDQGGKAFYGILMKDGESDAVLLEEEGDWERTNTDKYAKKIVKLIK